jgi:hypothetical protein
MPKVAARALRELHELVGGKGLAFTEPSVPAGWAALLLKRCVLGHPRGPRRTRLPIPRRSCVTDNLTSISFPTIRSAAGAVSRSALRARTRFVLPGTNRDTNWS